jgi:hypothetical protein
MSRRTTLASTSVGPARIRYRECDHCLERTADDDPIGWITVERMSTGLGQWGSLDFCRIEHLASYFTPEESA